MRVEFQNWEKLARVGQSKLLSFTMLMPVIGYMIIFNEELVRYFELTPAVFPQGNEQSQNISEETISRLYYFYFGFSFLGLSSFIYQLKCPRIIKEYLSDSAFVSNEHQLMTRKRTSRTIEYLKNRISNEFKSEFLEIEDALNHRHDEVIMKERDNIARMNLMLMLWQYENWVFPVFRALVTLFYFLGFSILAVPTVQTFIQVLQSFLNHM